MTHSGLSLEREAALAYSLQDFLARVWADVELNMGRETANFYKPDGVFSSGSHLLCRGREEIEKFYEHRRGLGGRVSRHFMSNCRFDFSSFKRDSRVTVQMGVTHYGDTGTPPFPSALPLAIYDIEVIAERQPDESWLIVRQHGEFIFLSATDNFLSKVPREMSREARGKTQPSS